MKKDFLRKKYILVFILIISTFRLYSIEVSYNREEQEGITFLYVTDIIRDSKGFMWFGTSRGLNRWDGYKYKHYLSDKNDSTTISSNKIQALLMAKNNLIWIGTSNGLNLFDPQTEKFQHFIHKPNDSNSISSNNILCIAEDKNGNIWAGTENGLNLYNIKSGTFKRIEYEYLTDQNHNYNKIYYLFCDSTNTINVGFSFSGLLRINAENFSKEFILTDNENNFINSVLDIIQVDSLNLLLGTWGNKIYNYSIKKNEIRKWKGNHLLNDNIIDHIEKDHNGNYWITEHNKQLLYISPELEIISRHTAISEFNTIPSNQISCIYPEGENIWFGTLNQGFFHINSTQQAIRNMNWETLNQSQLNNYQITSIAYGRKGEIIFGTSNNEIIIYNEKLNQAKRIPIKNDVAHRIYYDKFRQKIFYGSMNKSFSSININTLEENVEYSFPSFNTIYGIASNDSSIFIATWGNGLSVLNSKGELIQLGTTNTEKTFSTLNMIIDGDDLWIATYNNGLTKYNIKTNKFHSYLLQNQTSSILATNQVNLVTRLKNGALITSTSDLGLCYFDKTKEQFLPVGHEIGINGVPVKSIIEDNELNLWIVTEKEIFKTNHQFNTLSEYTVLDGLNYGIEHLSAAINNETNNIYIGGQQGVQYFNTSELVDDTTSSKVVITDIKVFDNSLEINSEALNGNPISYRDSIVLNHKQNFITIDFSSMQFNNKTNREFSYKLNGVNIDWINVPNYQNSVTYSNLIPGNYLFEVKVSNEHGIWIEDATNLLITITPPFYLTSWFRFIILIFVITIIVTFIRLREYSLVQDKRKLEAQVKERTSELSKEKDKVELQNKELEHANHVKNKFFNIIAHDLRNPIGSMVQLTDLLKENFKLLDEDQLQEVIESTSHSANSTLELLEDLLVWASSQTDKIEFDIQKINLNSIIKSETLNLSQQAKNKNIRIQNRIPDELYVSADKNSVKTIIRNLLSNAIKFSHKNSTIKIDSEIVYTFIKISIIDSGVGISYSNINKLFEMDEKNSTIGTEGEKGTGLGLNLCYEFTKRNGGEMTAESTLGVGSVFSFTLPLVQK